MTTDFPTTGLILGQGSHPQRERGVCVMEAVAWYAGEMHSDAPKCVDIALTSFCILVNDSVSDEARQDLIPLVPLLAGTKDDGKHEKRIELVGQWVTEVQARLKKNDFALLRAGGWLRIGVNYPQNMMEEYADNVDADSLESMPHLLAAQAVTEDELLDMVELLIKAEDVDA